MDYAIITRNLYAYMVCMDGSCMRKQCSTGCYVSGYCLRAHGQLYHANFESDAFSETEYPQEPKNRQAIEC